MPSDPALFSSAQMGASVLCVLCASSVSALFVFRRRIPRAAGARLLCVCALVALASWLRFGSFHVVRIDAPRAAAGERQKKIERHDLFQFHEFFHYYLGSKYFGELGYLSLYDCTALADEEIAREDGVEPRIHGFVRSLEDVLVDELVTTAISDCRDRARDRFSPARWIAFKSDVRALQRLVPDEAWNEVVNDKGLNPPPSFVLLSSAITNVIPIRARTAPTYLLTTSIDLLLLAISFAALRSAFGLTTALLASVYFGASFLASFGWLGGAVLRFTWVAAIVVALAAVRRGRHVLSGALMAWAVCDRVFPIGFAVGAAVPIAYAALRSPRHRGMVARYGAGFAVTVVVLFVASAVVFGVSSWSVFFSRMARDARVHNVLHVGLEKILAYRSWVPRQDFHGHEGFARFRAWNLHIESTLHAMRIPGVVLRIVALAGAVWASRRRRPFESSILCGVVTMFALTAPASYYFVILAIVPALIFRASVTAPSARARSREFVALLAFNVFWICTLVASHVSHDVIVYDFALCVVFAIFLVTWMAMWIMRARARGV